ncbi:MAG: Flp family type IVb pilin [Pseudomonadota bacterium]|nr:Flp family type IVb pilin [Pseudomonadota bacterium]MDQ2705012.1 Flp family type IVb pilin [Pseudomonadota bacterium]
MELIRRFLSDKGGATAIEYGLIIAVLSLVIVAGIGQAGNAISEMFANQERALQSVLND